MYDTSGFLNFEIMEFFFFYQNLFIYRKSSNLLGENKFVQSN